MERIGIGLYKIIGNPKNILIIVQDRGSISLPKFEMNNLACRTDNEKAAGNFQAAGQTAGFPVNDGAEDLLPAGRQHKNRAGSTVFQCRTGRFSVGPLYRDLHSASGFQAGDLALRPGGRQRWEQPYQAVVTLHQHLSNARRSAEVAVYLEDTRRMQVEEADGGKVGDKMAEMLLRLIAFPQSRPKSYRPGAAPACMAALKREASLQRRPRSLRQLRVSSRVI